MHLLFFSPSNLNPEGSSVEGSQPQVTPITQDTPNGQVEFEAKVAPQAEPDKGWWARTKEKFWPFGAAKNAPAEKAEETSEKEPAPEQPSSQQAQAADKTQTTWLDLALGDLNKVEAPIVQETPAVSATVKADNGQKKEGWGDWALRKGLGLAIGVGLWGVDPKTIQAKSEEALKEYQGGETLGAVLQTITPKVTELIEKFVDEKQDYSPVVKDFLKSQDGLIETLLRAILPMGAANIAKKIGLRERTAKDPAHHDAAFHLATYLLEVIVKGFEEAAREEAKLPPTLAPEERRQRMIELLKPLAIDLMTAAFPNKGQDLPVYNLHIPLTNFYLQDVLWKLIAERVLPEKLAEYYADFQKPQLNNEREQLKQYKNGEMLITPLQGAASLIQDKLPGLVENEKALIAEKVANEFFACSGDEKARLQDWLATFIGEFGASDLPVVKKLFGFIGNVIQPVVDHAALGLAKNAVAGKEENDDSQDISSLMIAKFLSAMGTFAEKKGVLVQARLLAVEADKKDPMEDPELLELFQDLTDVVLTLLDLDEAKKAPVAPLLQGIAYPLIVKQLPKQLIKAYIDAYAPQKNTSATKRRLNKICRNKEAVDQISNGCHVIAKQLTGTLQEILKKKGGTEVLGEGGKTWGHLFGTVVETLLLNVLTNLADKVPHGTPEERKLILSRLAEKVSSLLQEEIGKKEVQEAIAYAKTLKDPEEKHQAMMRALQPLAARFMELASPLQLPVPSYLDKPLKNFVETQALPHFLANWFGDFTRWSDQKEQLQNNLEANLPHGGAAAEVIAQFVSDFVPAKLADADVHVGNKVFSALKKTLKDAKEPAAKEIYQYITTNQAAIEKVIEDNVANFVASDSKGADFVLNQGAREGTKAALFKVLASVAERIEEIEQKQRVENGNPHLLVDIATKALKILSKHYGVLNKIKKEQGADGAFKVPHEAVLAEYGVKGGILHRGVPLAGQGELRSLRKEYRALVKKIRAETTNGPKAKALRLEARKIKAKIEKREALLNQGRKDNYFSSLAPQLMEIAGITKPEDLPVPKELQQIVFDQVQNELIPEVLTSVLSKLFDPHTLNSLLLSVLQSVNASAQKKSIEADYQPPKEAEQERLNEACGEFALKFVQMLPRSVGGGISWRCSTRLPRLLSVPLLEKNWKKITKAL